jgi:hypothetical protein
MMGRRLTIHAFSSPASQGVIGAGVIAENSCPVALLPDLHEEHNAPRRRTKGVDESYDEAPQAIFQTDGVEVHQQTAGNLAHSEVGQSLRVVCRKQCDDGFDLNKDGIANQDIRAKGSCLSK